SVRRPLRGGIPRCPVGDRRPLLPRRQGFPAKRSEEQPRCPAIHQAGERDPPLIRRESGLGYFSVRIFEQQRLFMTGQLDQADCQTAVWGKGIDQNQLAVARPTGDRRAAVLFAYHFRRTIAGWPIEKLHLPDAPLGEARLSSVRAE